MRFLSDRRKHFFYTGWAGTIKRLMHGYTRVHLNLTRSTMTDVKVVLVLFIISFGCVLSEDEKDYFDSDEEDSVADESYPLGVVAPLMPPPYGHRQGVPYNPSAPPPYGTSSSYHEQDYGGYGKSYRFGYKVEDPYTGNYQSRDEEKDDYGAVKGSYSLVEPDGNIRTVYYIADKYGFRAFVKNSHKPSSSHGLPPPF